MQLGDEDLLAFSSTRSRCKDNGAGKEGGSQEDPEPGVSSAFAVGKQSSELEANTYYS